MFFKLTSIEIITMLNMLESIAPPRINLKFMVVCFLNTAILLTLEGKEQICKDSLPK